MKFVKVKNPNNAELVRMLAAKLSLAGFTFNIIGKDKKTGFEFRTIRVDTNKRGYNKGGHQYNMGFIDKPRRTNCLSWNDWVEFNGLVNEVFDLAGASGKIYTLNGKFMIRDGDKVFTRNDWNDLAYENVGSIMYPISREDLYLHESEF